MNYWDVYDRAKKNKEKFRDDKNLVIFYQSVETCCIARELAKVQTKLEGGRK